MELSEESAQRDSREAAQHAIAALIVRYFAEGWDEAKRMMRDGDDLDRYSLADIIDRASRRFFQAQRDAERLAALVMNAPNMGMSDLPEQLRQMAEQQRAEERRAARDA